MQRPTPQRPTVRAIDCKTVGTIALGTVRSRKVSSTAFIQRSLTVTSSALPSYAGFNQPKYKLIVGEERRVQSPTIKAWIIGQLQHVGIRLHSTIHRYATIAHSRNLHDVANQSAVAEDAAAEGWYLSGTRSRLASRVRHAMLTVSAGPLALEPSKIVAMVPTIGMPDVPPVVAVDGRFQTRIAARCVHMPSKRGPKRVDRAASIGRGVTNRGRNVDGRLVDVETVVVNHKRAKVASAVRTAKSARRVERDCG